MIHQSLATTVVLIVLLSDSTLSPDEDQQYVVGTSPSIKACLHGGGGPQIGDITCGGSSHLSCKRDRIKMRDYMDRRVSPRKRVTSPTLGPTPLCKEAVTE